MSKDGVLLLLLVVGLGMIGAWWFFILPRSAQLPWARRLGAIMLIGLFCLVAVLLAFALFNVA